MTASKVVDDLGPGQVQHVAGCAARVRWPAGDADRPVGMRREQLAARADHLRFDPDAEAHARAPRSARASPSRPSGSLRRSTNQSPSEHVSSSRRRTSRRRARTARCRGRARPPRSRRGASSSKSKYVASQLLIDDRARAVAPRAAGEALAEQAVECVAHAAEALGRSRREWPPGTGIGARLEPPTRTCRGRCRCAAACRPERFDLGLGQEVAGVDEARRDGLAGGLVVVRAAQDEERVVLVTGVAALARHRPAPMGEAAGDEVPLPQARFRSGWSCPSPRRAGHGQAHGGRQRGPAGRPRCEPWRTGDRRVVAEDRVGQRGHDPRRFVGQVDFERIGLGLVSTYEAGNPGSGGFPRTIRCAAYASRTAPIHRRGRRPARGRGSRRCPLLGIRTGPGRRRDWQTRETRRGRGAGRTARAPAAGRGRCARASRPRRRA